jgi:CheY-like chemotaxis protein
MALATVLAVDDGEVVRETLCTILQNDDFEVTRAANVSQAHKFISSQKYDVLLSDLHRPDAGDGLTVVSAMRHANPKAVTPLLSAFPEMSAAANAILLQADEILVKPMNIPDLLDAIMQGLAKGPLYKRKVETLATILERTTEGSIDDRYAEVEREDTLAVHLSRQARCRHLPQLFRDLGRRLQAFQPLGSKKMKSQSASDHGLERRRRGYTAAMMVEESRILQVTIFRTLQKNLDTIDFSVLLLGSDDYCGRSRFADKPSHEKLHC